MLTIALVAAGLLMLPLAGEGVALYLYAFPLFGILATYVLQYRRSLTRRWWAVLVAIVPLSIAALALDWPFSGHVLWNILFLGHNEMVVKSRAWRWVLLASLAHLLILKAIFQTPRDLLGALIAAALAAVLLLLVRRRTKGD